MEVVRVAIPSDANYAVGMLVTAGSIAMHASRDVVLDITILDGGVREEQYAYLRERLALLHPHVVVHPARMSEESFKRFPEWHGNRMTYARILIPDLMPDADYVIYTDSDMLWMADIAELWRQRRENISICAVHDAGAENGGARAWQERYGFTFDAEHYFCGGLQLMNLKRFREKDYMRRAFEALLKYPGARFADQDGLNLVVGSDVSLQDPHWMRFTYDVKPEDLKKPIVLHYSNEIPWKRKRKCEALTDTIMIWHRYNGKIRGISTWASLRMFFVAKEILGRRLLSHIATTPIIRSLFFWVLNHTGRSSDTTDLKYWCHAI